MIPKMLTKPRCVELVDGVATVDETNDDMLLRSAVCDDCVVCGCDGIGASAGDVTAVNANAGDFAFNGVLLALLIVAPVLLQLLSLLYNPMWNFGLYGRSMALVVCDRNGGIQSRSSFGDVGRLICCMKSGRIIIQCS